MSRLLKPFLILVIILLILAFALPALKPYENLTESLVSSEFLTSNIVMEHPGLSIRINPTTGFQEGSSVNVSCYYPAVYNTRGCVAHEVCLLPPGVDSVPVATTGLQSEYCYRVSCGYRSVERTYTNLSHGWNTAVCKVVTDWSPGWYAPINYWAEVMFEVGVTDKCVTGEMTCPSPRWDCALINGEYTQYYVSYECVSNSCREVISDASKCVYGCGNNFCGDNPCQGVQCRPDTYSCSNGVQTMTHYACSPQQGGLCLPASTAQTACSYGCSGSTCLITPQLFCGDGACSYGENEQNCGLDCSRCGSGYCSSIESCSTCPSDCGYCGLLINNIRISSSNACSDSLSSFQPDTRYYACFSVNGLRSPVSAQAWLFLNNELVLNTHSSSNQFSLAFTSVPYSNLLSVGLTDLDSRLSANATLASFYIRVEQASNPASLSPFDYEPGTRNETVIGLLSPEAPFTPMSNEVPEFFLPLISAGMAASVLLARYNARRLEGVRTGSPFISYFVNALVQGRRRFSEFLSGLPGFFSNLFSDPGEVITGLSSMINHFFEFESTGNPFRDFFNRVSRSGEAVMIDGLLSIPFSAGLSSLLFIPGSVLWGVGELGYHLSTAFSARTDEEGVELAYDNADRLYGDALAGSLMAITPILGRIYRDARTGVMGIKWFYEPYFASDSTAVSMIKESISPMVNKFVRMDLYDDIRVRFSNTDTFWAESLFRNRNTVISFGRTVLINPETAPAVFVHELYHGIYEKSFQDFITKIMMRHNFAPDLRDMRACINELLVDIGASKSLKKFGYSDMSIKSMYRQMLSNELIPETEMSIHQIALNKVLTNYFGFNDLSIQYEVLATNLNNEGYTIYQRLVNMLMEAQADNRIAIIDI